MISFVHQPLLPLGADERAVLANHDVVWATLMTQFECGALNELARKYHAAAREVNRSGPIQRGPGRPRSRGSAERQAAVGREEAPVTVGAGELIALPANAHPARTGRSPKPFHAMVLAFFGAAADDRPATPEEVYRLLAGNPTFAARCGFQYPGTPQGRRSTRLTIPALKTLQTFFRILADYGIWGEIRRILVRQNLATGVIARSDAFVADTTHLLADSTPCVVELPIKAEAKQKRAPCPAKPKGRRVVAERASNNKRKTRAEKKRKVRLSRLTKRCRHEDHDACNCKWVESDAGAGVVVKSKTKKFWAHKAAVIGYAGTTIPLDVAVVSNASAHDSKTLEPHLDRLKIELPEAFAGVLDILADPSYDEAPARGRIANNHGGLALKTKINPRGRKESALPGHEGRFKLNPQGQPICLREEPLVLTQRDQKQGEYIWRGPLAAGGKPLCEGCPLAQQCGLQSGRRTLHVPREVTPQIDWEHPQHLKSEQTRYRDRTAVERQIERLKGPLDRNRLPCRGRARVQAFLDLRLAALHALLGFT